VRVKNIDTGQKAEFTGWVAMRDNIFAMVKTEFGRFDGWPYSKIEEAKEYPSSPRLTRSEPDYKQANIALVNEIMARQEKALERTLNATSGIDFTYWKGHNESIEDIIQWINEHNPKGGE